MPGFPYSCPSVVCLSRTPSCLLTHLSRLLPPTCLSSISPCHTVYLPSIVCTPVPPAHLLDPQSLLTFYLLPFCYSKVCCLLSRLLPLSLIRCPLSALLSPPPPTPCSILYMFQCQGLQTASIQGHREKHAKSNKYKTAILNIFIFFSIMTSFNIKL